MDQITKYRKIIKQLIEKYAAIEPAYGEIENETIFDEENDHYEMMQIGWHGQKRIHGSVLHIDIRKGKVWIQHDGIEDGVAEELVEAGVPRDHVVLGFYPADVRPLTEYAAG